MPRSRRPVRLTIHERIVLALFRSSGSTSQAVIRQLLAQPSIDPLWPDRADFRRRLARHSKELGVERPRRRDAVQFVRLPGVRRA